ncbi:MAG: helix-turn-helix domain-containing protein [Candidatus Pseudobacter hemicellulosilyticus]|uniref:Helix-turn-helix domain-containing protein n=1 Tax=Candidatus Pseudobacter hemicellulosilyticus TaxID=3121375 RepID=A0AAJ6BID4_9BACT|nr:MAG: helix-turn-helix domain-containing protein [Pseudobacter sp.]
MYKVKLKESKIRQSDTETVYTKQVFKEKSLGDKPFLKVTEVAEVLDISRQAVYDMINSGRLEVHRLSSRKTRVSKEDLQSYLRKVREERFDERTESVVEPEESSGVVSYYSIKDLKDLFGKSRDGVYAVMTKYKVSKVKRGVTVFYVKAEADKAYRLENKPKYLGHERERMQNVKEAEKGLSISDCYAIEECVIMFKKRPGLLYGIFNRRKVPKFRDGQKVYYSKKAVDRIYSSMNKRS